MASLQCMLVIVLALLVLTTGHARGASTSTSTICHTPRASGHSCKLETVCSSTTVTTTAITQTETYYPSTLQSQFTVTSTRTDFTTGVTVITYLPGVSTYIYQTFVESYIGATATSTDDTEYTAYSTVASTTTTVPAPAGFTPFASYIAGASSDTSAVRKRSAMPTSKS